MKNNKRIILIASAILIFVISLFIIFNNEKDVPFSKKIFNDNNIVVNQSEMVYADTIVLAGLHGLNIKYVRVLISDLDIKMIDNMEYQAYIFPVANNTYVIRIKNLLREDAIEVLSHELIHLKQIHDQILINDGNMIYWGIIRYDIEHLPEYFDRPWEIDAFNRQQGLKQKIKTLLYK